MSVSTDILHYGHIRIMQKAAALGELTVGILTDNVICQYRRPSLVPFEERWQMIKALGFVSRVIEKDTLSYRPIIEQYHPDIIVHGDEWKTGSKAKLRWEVIRLLEQMGGELIEFPYTKDENINALERDVFRRYAIPEIRRGMLRRLLKLKASVRVLEAHSGLTGLVAENAKVHMCNGEEREFDAMWISSLCDSSSRGKPDIELVDWSSRIDRINEIMEVTTKPIIVDGDTGGLTEHFVYNVQTLERLGVSAVIIEDKTGLKKNSLFGTEVKQTQADPENFGEKIRLAKHALKTSDFMIFARIESLILEQGMEDALMRAGIYVNAGADGIMIHSRQKSPDEVFEFCGKFRHTYPDIPIVAIPTTYNQIREEELIAHGINIIIHANHLLRSAFPAMTRTAEAILRDGCSGQDAEKYCMPIKEIINFIPVEGE
ncbi:MAG: phosphoenolpyruvate mutase [Clostridium sp.]|nr:phosphoenolpyruvate mutase [Clostridium sp.]